MKRLFGGLLALAVMLSCISPALAARGDRSISDDGINFIKKYEGFAKTPYIDKGTWRIGYGTACTSSDYPQGITEAQATELLRADIVNYENKVNTYAREHGLRFTQNEFDALVSFTYNLGNSWMADSYKLSSYLINGLENYDDIEIVDAIVVWCHVGKVVDKGLATRRIAEARLLLYGDYTGDSSPEFTYAVLNPDGGTAPTDVKCFYKGTEMSTLPLVRKTDRVFAGWFTDKNRIVRDNDIINEPMNLTAKWFVDVRLPFEDVPDGAWYYHYVGDLYHYGIVDGMSPTEFAPRGSVTYGQALKLIMLSTGMEPSGMDAAGDSHWAQKYKDLAISEGIINERFCPDLDGVITRAEIAALASAAMGLKDPSVKTPFEDTADRSVLALYEAGIVEGTTDRSGTTYFYPDDDITRAEISTIIWRIETSTESRKEPGSIKYGTHTLKVLSSVKKNTYNNDNFYTQGGFRRYSGMETFVGIDVSHHQGNIDWNKVKAAGVQFAMIRVGGRGYGTDGVMFDDTKFLKNIAGATAAGIHVGIYYFSQAISVQEARQEARYVIDKIKNYNITYPVVFDWEFLGNKSHRTYTLDTDTLCKAANAFCELIEQAGYKPMIYFNLYNAYLKYDLSRVNKYDFWFAEYTPTPSFYYNFHIWQYSDKGKVPGISGNVDLDISFVDYSKR